MILKKIGKLFDERLETKLEEKFETKLEEKLEAKFEEKLEPIKKDIQSLKNGHRRLRKDFSLVLKHLDGERCKSRKENYKNRRPVAFTFNGLD